MKGTQPRQGVIMQEKLYTHQQMFAGFLGFVLFYTRFNTTYNLKKKPPRKRGTSLQNFTTAALFWERIYK